MKSSENQEKDYLIKLVKNLEVAYTENRTIPFRIEEQKEKGLLVKVGGLFSYVPFSKMPWKYAFQDAWSAVFPLLQSKVFFCKITQIDQDPLRVLIDPSATLFRKAPFIPTESYEAIIIHKAKYGVFVELGACFQWKSGSQVGLLHDSILQKRQLHKDDLTIGQSISTTYYGKDNSDNLILDDAERAAFNSKTIADLVGQLVPVNVQRASAEDKPTFLVQNKFKGVLSVTKAIYTEEEKKYVRKALKELEDGQTILCKVMEINYQKGNIKLKWHFSA